MSWLTELGYDTLAAYLTDNPAPADELDPALVDEWADAEL